jgi:hypothetical protein
MVYNSSRIGVKEQRIENNNYHGETLFNLLIFRHFALINLMKGAFSILGN